MFRLAAGALQDFNHPVRARVIQRVDNDLRLGFAWGIFGEPGGDNIASKSIVCHHRKIVLLG